MSGKRQLDLYTDCKRAVHILYGGRITHVWKKEKQNQAGTDG